MPTNRLVAIVVESLDNAWLPLAARAADLTDDEYAWEPVAHCWTVRRDLNDRWIADWQDPDPVPAPITTIAWRCWHIAVDCLDSYSARVFGATGTGLTGTTWVGTWREASALMDRSFAVLREGVAGWSDDDLLAPLGPTFTTNSERTNLHLALHAEREIVHHGAEIALLRDLYRGRELSA